MKLMKRVPASSLVRYLATVASKGPYIPPSPPLRSRALLVARLAMIGFGITGIIYIVSLPRPELSVIDDNKVSP